MRSDARRNVVRLLDAAEEVFARDGLAVPVDVIAARAGVGVGTLYRHFPTKQALFKAVVATRLQGLVERAKDLSDYPDAGEAIFTFVAEVAKLAMQKQDLTDELARAGIDEEEIHSTVREQLEKAFEVLLRRAQAAGAVRRDITTPEVAALLMGTCLAARMRGASLTTPRLVTVLCDGLRTNRVAAKP
ncbi:MAG TPA: helix-turn-helix domain-containing protein, partial [Acidimicrobiales bacterium]|nr:helix-turn-helix domain-containing protein [Acidimicrobiales bacterium]